MNHKEGIALAIFLVLVVIGLGIYSRSDIAKEGTGAQQKQTQLTSSAKPETSMETTTSSQEKEHFEVILRTTEGPIVIALNAGQTPKTVDNFVTLAKKGFYDNTIFHRVIKGFMIQGGDPQGTGMGGPGYKFADEPFTGEYTRGTIAMANSGPNTNGSQFFIMHADYPLPKNYVIFGHVVSGMDAVDKIANTPTTMGGDGAMSKPINPIKITSVEVAEK
jgi:cyclophilin family peptidyl-prolyl cis-trans isomerase